MDFDDLLDMDPQFECRPAFKFFSRYKCYFRDVVMGFDMRDFSQKAMMNFRETYQSGDTLPLADDMEESPHEGFLEHQLNVWNARNHFVSQTNLETFVFDLGGLYCPTACCRGEALANFFRYWLHLVAYCSSLHIAFDSDTSGYRLEEKNKKLDIEYDPLYFPDESERDEQEIYAVKWKSKAPCVNNQGL